MSRALRMADGGEGAGAVAPAAVVAPVAAPVAAPPVVEAPKVDTAKIAKEAEAKARVKFLADAGYDTEEAFEADKAARKKEADAKLSEQERLSKAFEASQKANAKAAEKLSAAEAERDAARSELSLVKSGVAIDQVDVASYLLSKAKGDEGFDEAKWLAKLKTEKPFLFSSAQPAAPQLANTTAPTPSGGNPFGVAPAPSAGVFDAMKASAAEVAAYKRQFGL